MVLEGFGEDRSRLDPVAIPVHGVSVPP
jgi:hypothetical protein